MLNHNSYGQEVLDQGSEARDALEGLAMAHYDGLKDSTRFMLRAALRRMAGGIRVAPFVGFDISYASLISVMSVILTYVIILLQFTNS